MSAKNASRSKLNFAASISRVRWTSATMGSSHMTLISHEFFRGTDDRHFTAQLLTHDTYSPGDLCVCQVLAIPGQQIVNGVNRCHGNMRGVGKSMRRKDAGRHDGLCQRCDVRRNVEGWQAADYREALLHFRRIAKAP